MSLVLGASGDSDGVATLRSFIAVLLIVLIALLLTTRIANRVQRIKPVAALTSSGWLAIGVGFVLGPHVLNAVQPDTLLAVRPLLVIGLGWIGIIVGLQAHRQVLRQTPGALWRWTGVDVAISLAIGAGAVAFFLAPQFDPMRLTMGWLLPPIVLLGCATIGWAPETRSLRSQGSETDAAMVRVIRSGSGLASLAAVSVFGLAIAVSIRSETGELRIDLMAGAVAIASTLALAALLGLGSRSLLRLAHRDRSQALVIFLGTVTLVAGIADELDFSAVFAAMLVGVVISNLAGNHLRSFEWFILRAEHAVANLFFLLAGVLLVPGIGVWGWGIVVMLVVTRAIFKSIALRRVLAAQSPGALDTGAALLWAPLRQSPIAIALAVGLVLIESSMLNLRLLTVVALVGLFSELLPTGLSMLLARRGAGDASSVANGAVDAGASADGSQAPGAPEGGAANA